MHIKISNIAKREFLIGWRNTPFHGACFAFVEFTMAVLLLAYFFFPFFFDAIDTWEPSKKSTATTIVTAAVSQLFRLPFTFVGKITVEEAWPKESQSETV
jgi:hypothetical protein